MSEGATNGAAKKVPSGKGRSAHEVPKEEIRLAVVLNGGVSLAVWMGGVALELDQLARGSGVYGTLLDFVGCTARIDVIAGTSAGGINGAALALARANPAADLSVLRDIWTEQGRIETLLRQPFRGEPTSLLRGDEYFLPALHEAMVRLTRCCPKGRPPHPIDLTITTTLLKGTQRETVDSVGQKLPQWVHDGGFHFGGGDPESADDSFASANLADTAARLALAARCTASFPVAFEPSYVPVNLPDDHRRLADEAHVRPDMDAQATWGSKHRAEPGWLPPDANHDASRYVVDGGVLANMPTGAALRAIESMPAGDMPTRRVMLLVHPHAPSAGLDQPDDPNKAPTVVGTLTGLLGALSAQGSRTFVERVEAHNLQAATHRGTRLDILGTVEDGAGLKALANAVYPHYRALRMRRAARDVADWAARIDEWNPERVRRNAFAAQEGWQPLPYVPSGTPFAQPEPSDGTQVQDDESATGNTGWGWGVRGALGVADAASDLIKRLIWVLPADRQGEKTYANVKQAREDTWRLRKELVDARALTDRVWREDPDLRKLEPSRELFDLRLAFYQLAMGGREPECVAGNHELFVTRLENLAKHESKGSESKAEEIKERVGNALYTSLANAENQLDAGSAPKPKSPVPCGSGAAGEYVRQRVQQILSLLAEPLATLQTVVSEESAKVLDPGNELAKWRRALADATGPELLLRLLALEVATTALGDERTTETAWPVELVQLSAAVENGFCDQPRSADDKLGGMSLNRFGGFLKGSWRANDWIWGRLDAATVLCRLILDPATLRRAAFLRHDDYDEAAANAEAWRVVCNILHHIWAGLPEFKAGSSKAVKAGELVERFLPNLDPRLATLAREAQEELVEAILRKPDDLDSLAPTLPKLAELAAWAVHLSVAAEEVPALARAITMDRVEGANIRSHGERFLAQIGEPKPGNGSLLGRLETRNHTGGCRNEPELADSFAALRAFDQAGIGREALDEEAPSDQMLRTATSAAAVAVTVLDSDGVGVPAVKPVTRTLRGGMLVPYWIVTGLTSGGSLSRALALLGLTLGTVLAALALLGALPASLASAGAVVGTSSLLLALAYGAIRTGTLLHSVVLVSPIIPLIALATQQASSQPAGQPTGQASGQQAGLAGVVVVLVIVAALMALGSLPAPLGSVPAELDRLADRLDPGGAGSAVAGPVRKRIVRRTKALFRKGGPPIAVLLMIGAFIKLAVDLIHSAWLVEKATWCQQQPWVALACAAGLIGLGSAFAYGSGASLRKVRVADPGAATKDAVKYAPVTHPAGVNAGWAVLYGVGYLVLASLILWAPGGWLEQAAGRAILGTAVLLAVMMIVIVPLLVPWRARRRIYKRLSRTAADSFSTRRSIKGRRNERAGKLYGLELTEGRGRSLAARLAGEQRSEPDLLAGPLISWLLDQDQAYRFLVRPKGRGAGVHVE